MPRWPRTGLLVTTALGTALLAEPALAQVQCSVLTLPQILLSFSDLAGPASITPQNMRNFACSVYGGGSSNSITAGAGLAASPSNPITAGGTLSLAPIGSHDLLANATGGSAAPSDTTLTALIDAAIGSTQGEILYRGASGWVALAPGSKGQKLVAGGSAANPAWSFEEKTTGLSWSSVNPVVSATQPIWIATKPTSIIVDSIDSITGGSGSPAFTVQAVTGSATLTCGGSDTITVGTVEATATCTAGNTLAAGSLLNAVIVVTAGTPEPAGVFINYHVVP